MNDIEIKGFLKNDKLSISKNKVRISKKTIFKYLEYDISLENIVHSKMIKSEINRDLILFSLIIFIVGVVFNMIDSALIFAIFIGISLIFLFIGLFTRRKTIIIESNLNAPIILPFRKNNEKIVNDFADTLIEMSKDYLIVKYGRVDKDLPIESQLENLEYLWNRNLIDELKFEELKNILLDK